MMIVAKNNQKTYGALHTENYFSFLGFAKKTNSDEIQEVDVFLDDKLIDTITADKTIQKINDIYDVNGFGFTYHLPEEYIETESSFSFKNQYTQEHLNNSPYKLINKSNPNFNKARFIYSLSKPIYGEKTTQLSVQNSIGFLSIKENLEDENFINYIKELITFFPNCVLKAFCFNMTDKKLIQNIFNKAEIIFIDKIADITNKIDIFISNRNYLFKNVLDLEIAIYKYCNNVYLIVFDYRFINTKLDEFKKLNLKNNQNISSIDTICFETLKLKENEFNIKLKTIKDYFIEIIHGVFKSKEIKQTLIKTSKLYSNNQLVEKDK